jgi:hypothetical protein
MKASSAGKREYGGKEVGSSTGRVLAAGFQYVTATVAWRAFRNLWTVYFYKFQIFSVRGKPQVTEAVKTGSMDTVARTHIHIYIYIYIYIRMRERLINYGLERKLKKAAMNHFGQSGEFDINILMKITANLQQTWPHFRKKFASGPSLTRLNFFFLNYLLDEGYAG